MYYEIYVDVLFLVNFVMDYLLLLLVKRMLSCTATRGRIFLGAAVGASLTCIVMILPIPYAVVKLILFHLVINTCMIRVGLKIKQVRIFIKAFLLLYIGGFLLGGIMEAFRQYVKIGSLFLGVAIGGYHLTIVVWKFIRRLQKWNEYLCEADIYANDQIYHVKCLIDTGNQLRDTVSGKAVSILNHSTAKKLLEQNEHMPIRYIPYRTINGENRVMTLFKADKMEIFAEQTYSIDEPLIGISEAELTATGEYEMILNPNLL